MDYMDDMDDIILKSNFYCIAKSYFNGIFSISYNYSFMTVLLNVRISK